MRLSKYIVIRSPSDASGENLISETSGVVDPRYFCSHVCHVKKEETLSTLINFRVYLTRIQGVGELIQL